MNDIESDKQNERIDYTQILNAINKASLFDLHRLTVAIQNELENPQRIKEVRRCFAEGDVVEYFDEDSNTCHKATVLQKNRKRVLLKSHYDDNRWDMAYYYLNIDKVDTEIHAAPKQKLSKNNLSVGECVGFNHDGKQIYGVITKLNQKTISLLTRGHGRWRVYYTSLFKVIDAELAEELKALSRQQKLIEQQN